MSTSATRRGHAPGTQGTSFGPAVEVDGAGMGRARRVRRGGATVAALSAIGLVASAAPAQAASVTGGWGTDGRVAAIAVSGSKVYVGGDFTRVTTPGGQSVAAADLAVFDRATGRWDTGFRASTNGVVNALAVSGGLLYVGGSFTTVSGVGASNLAAVSTMSGALASGWKARANRPVNALAVTPQGLVAGGSFGGITVESTFTKRVRLARMNLTTGAVDSTFTTAANNTVKALALAPGGTALYVGGNFTTLGGTSRVYLGALALTTGALTAWRPAKITSTGARPIHGIAVSSAAVVVGAGGEGGTCAALSPTNGALRWTKAANGDVDTVAIVGSKAVCGGHFAGLDAFDGQKRSKVAVVDVTTGVTSSFAPWFNSPRGVLALVTDGGSALAGGDFTRVGTTPMPHVATIWP